MTKLPQQPLHRKSKPTPAQLAARYSRDVERIAAAWRQLTKPVQL